MSTETLYRVAVATTGIFAGAALYVGLVQVPAILEGSSSKSDMSNQFKSYYHRAASFQGALGIVSSSLIFYLFYKGGKTDKNLLASAGMLMGIVPYTIFHLIPVATPLLEGRDAEAQENLVSYARRHLVRVALSGGAFYTLLFRPIKN